ncbi:MAG: HD domain-containing protein [Candidatus Dadabacteria bacterium]|nr:HD domain-containing protein [Candidatus Dadabacteria bacterium]NIQ16295.1 HD domain-containing protein [Candidatus Dadabacteria bacterium]
MNQSKLIEYTKDFVKEKLNNDKTGHDWWHTFRVFKIAEYMAQKEGADLLIVSLASLLHDIADWKFNDGDENLGPTIAEQWLKKFDIENEIIQHIKEIINSVSYKGNNVKDNMKTIEGKVVQDADRIDAIGAIGIARTFAYGGYKGNEIHNPDIKPQIHNNFEEYKSSKGTTINHFYEKLLLLKDRMNTKTGKEIAEERHKFLEQFLNKFLDEWEVNTIK